jgi:hypothetical protein
MECHRIAGKNSHEKQMVKFTAICLSVASLKCWFNRPMKRIFHCMKYFSHEPKRSLPCSQSHVIGFYLAPVQSISLLDSLLLYQMSMLTALSRQHLVLLCSCFVFHSRTSATICLYDSIPTNILKYSGFICLWFTSCNINMMLIFPTEFIMGVRMSFKIINDYFLKQQ